VRFTSQPFAGLPSQSSKPALHVNPHAPLLHLAVALAGVAHGVHEVPHDAVLVASSHALPPHAWYPALHAMPQLVPSQVDEPFAGTAHAVHEAPHVAVLVLFEQLVPSQLW
jgi:hypothetical protein